MSVSSTLLLQQFDHSCVQAIRCAFPGLLCCVLEPFFTCSGHLIFMLSSKFFVRVVIIYKRHDEIFSQESIVLKLKVSTGCYPDCNSIHLFWQPVKRHSRKSLRVLGTVGEPINPSAWRCEPLTDHSHPTLIK